MKINISDILMCKIFVFNLIKKKARTTIINKYKASFNKTLMAVNHAFELGISKFLLLVLFFQPQIKKIT